MRTIFVENPNPNLIEQRISIVSVYELHVSMYEFIHAILLRQTLHTSQKLRIINHNEKTATIDAILTPMPELRAKMITKETN